MVAAKSNLTSESVVYLLSYVWIDWLVNNVQRWSMIVEWLLVVASDYFGLLVAIQIYEINNQLKFWKCSK